MTHSVTIGDGTIFNAKYVKSAHILVCDWIGEFHKEATARTCCILMTYLAKLHQAKAHSQ